MAELTQEHVVDMMRDEKVVMMTSTTSDGWLHSHPMAVQEVTDDADLWFFIGLQGEQADELRADSKANVAFAKMGSWLSVAGSVAFVNDREKIDELWDDQVAAWFDGGKDDPNLGLIRFVSASAQHWGQPGGKVAALASIVKARVSGDRPSGTSSTTEL